jgi:hypothetical protein
VRTLSSPAAALGRRCEITGCGAAIAAARRVLAERQADLLERARELECGNG